MGSSIVYFKVSSALKNLIGKELITNNYVAVFELVKNSFDAGASTISVSIDLKNNKIIVKDNGCGMSTKDVVEKWLFIGYSDKKNNSTGSFSGNKGIGRFSCDRLGSKLSLISVKDGNKTMLDIDWDSYEENQSKEIQSLPIVVNDAVSTEKNGTTLIIGDLRTIWTEKDVEKTKEQLLRLISPNKRDVTQNLSLYYINPLGIINSYEKLKNDVFDYMQDKTVFIKSIFSDDVISTELYDRGKRILMNVATNNSLIKQSIMLVFFSDRNAKAAFKRKTGTDLINYGNLFIYRNGFRVYPFGEANFDPFGLAERKTQGYNRNLGPREIVGWIDISDAENHFMESTSRDRGFIENPYSQSLKEVYMEYIHKPLEKYVQLINYGNIALDDYDDSNTAKLVVGEVIKAFTLKNSIETELDEDFLLTKENKLFLSQLEDIRIPSAERKRIIREAQNRIKNQETELAIKQKKIDEEEKKNKQLTKEIKEKNKFIEFKNPSRQEALEHDLGLVIKKLSFLRDDLFTLNKELNNTKIDKAIKDASWAIYRIKGIRNFILKTNMDTIIKSDVEVGRFLKEYSTIIDYDKLSINFYIEKEFVVKANIFDLITVFDNIVSNVDHLCGTKLDVFVNESSIKFISDTFDAVKKDVDFARVFDYGYTTATGGTGIGMFFVKQIADKLKLNVCMNRLDDSNLVVMEISKNA